MRAWAYTGLLGLAIALGAAPVAATPQTYNFVSGDVTLVASQAPNTVIGGPANVSLSGVSVTVDTAALTLNSLTFAVGPSVAIPISYAGYTSFTLDGAIVTGSGGTLTPIFLGPPDLYGFSITLGVTGQFDAFSPTHPLPPTITNGLFTLPGAAGSGEIVIDGNDLFLNSITIGSIDPDGAGGEAPLLVKGDFIFVGAVPEPGTALLLGGGLAALAGLSRRRER